jgi:DNA-binding LacI/PurR family transcriptional regulator
MTLKQLAKQAGCSIGSVSMALRGDARVAAETARRIRLLAEQSGYVPNHLGQALRSGKSRLVGYLLSTVQDSFYGDLLQGIGSTLAAEGYGLLVGLTDGAVASEAAFLRIFRQKAVDGLIVSNYHDLTVPLLREMAEAALPIVVCDFPSFAERVPAVMVDEVEAARQGIRHLWALGHRRFAYAYRAHPHSLARYEANREGVQARGGSAPLLCANEAELTAVLRGRVRPTAVICYSDHWALQVCRLARNLGLSVPADLSVLGFDDMPFAAWPEHALTTLAQPKEGLGRMAAALLLQRMKGDSQAQPRPVAPELVTRNSTGPVPVPRRRS